MSDYDDKWDFKEANRIQREGTERAKWVGRVHAHQIAATDGNKLICKCGQVMGFMRKPTKASP